MLSDHFIDQVLCHLNYKPTKDQEKLIDTISNSFLFNDKAKIFIINGYAGTGKTTLISSIVNALDTFRIRYSLLAPTGRAAKVLASYSKKPAYTIHKKIFRQKSSKDGFGKFVLNKNLYSNTLFIVDEASMISNQEAEMKFFGSGKLLDDLIQYVFSTKGCKVILVGDTAQLPPIGIPLSPALDKFKLEGYGCSVSTFSLKEVVRQAMNSGILWNAIQVRLKQEINSSNQWPLIEKRKFPDIKIIGGQELTEYITDSYRAFGIDETTIICRSNKRANKFNQGIRNQILGMEEELCKGDMLMVVKNNYYYNEGQDSDFIANGDILEIVKVKKYYNLYGFHFADIVARFVDYSTEIEVRILLDTLMYEGPSLNLEDNKKLYYSILEDYADVKGKRNQYEKVHNNEFFNALQVKYAYALTCHKAQGGQWKSVFIDFGYITQEMINKAYLRWLYTAITRATEKLYFVNIPEFLVVKD